MIRVLLPAHLRTLAQVSGEVKLRWKDRSRSARCWMPWRRAIPMLRGTIRDHVTQQRRPFLRFFACAEDLSHEPPDAPLPDAVVTEAEPFLVIAAVAGG